MGKRISKFNVFTGPIHTLYATDFKVVKNHLIRNIKDEIVIENASFYPTFGGFINMEHDVRLSDVGDAYSLVNDSVTGLEEKIMRCLNDKSIPDDKKAEILAHYENACAFLYFEPNELKYAFSLSKDEFNSYKQKVLLDRYKKNKK